MKESRTKKQPESDSEISAWVSKSRKLEKKRALQLSKIFEEQDKIAVEGSDDEDTAQHTANLAGLKVLHGLDKVMEGGTVVLTIKDQPILADGDVNEEVDMLENIEIGEQKRRDEAYKAAKKKTGVYEDKFNDDPSLEKKMLPQYDDPAAEEGVTLDEKGRFSGEAEKKLEELRRRLTGVSTNTFEDLTSSGKVSSDYYTHEEMLKFKKPKKKKSLRKKDKLDINALEAEAVSSGLGVGDLGSRSNVRRQAIKEEQERLESKIRSNAYQSAYAKAEEASKLLRQEQTFNVKTEEDETPAFVDDDEDLRKSLEKARRLALKKHEEDGVSGPQAIALLATSNHNNETDGQNPTAGESRENKVVFTEMEEFVWGLHIDEEARKPESEDVFMHDDEEAIVPDEEKTNEAGGWTEVQETNEDEQPNKEDKEEIVPDETIHEVAVGKGLSGALKLLKDRGTLKESIEWGGRNMDKKKSKLVGIVDDDEKETQKKREIRIERTDEFGRIFVTMVAEGTKRPQISLSILPPPRTINVQKYAESRALELHSLQSIIENRVNNDYRSQRNKRRRTTAFDNQIARKGCRRKRQKVGIVGKALAKSGLEEDELKKLPRRVRRRYELKNNPENDFCTSGDGTKRLRTHVWHAKRFAMTKLWGYHLPFCLQGRGKGSRALLKRLKEGVLVHDASYYTAVQLEGPEDSLTSVLRSVLEPSPTTTNPENLEDSLISGVTYGSAMMRQDGGLIGPPIAPVTYIWQPTSQQNISTRLDEQNHYTSFGQHGIDDDSNKHSVELCEKSDKMKHGSSFRHLWVWIHASAFEEGFDNLKIACRKEMEKTGILINCFSLEGQLAKLELFGLGAFQLLQKILHPVGGISENHCQLKKHIVIEEGCVSQNRNSTTLKNGDSFPSCAMLPLNVKDPRELPWKRNVVPVEHISTTTLSDASETKCKELAELGGILEENKDLCSLSLSNLEDCQSNVDDLWYATARGLRPPVEDSVLSKEKHHERMVNFCLVDTDSGDASSSTKVQSSRSCPILLLKNDVKELSIGWSVILPLSWVKAFWIPLISNGARAIGLQEKHWITCEMGLPVFPSDFPDCKAYSCLMEEKEAAFNKKEELRPPSIRHLRVPIQPPWGIVCVTFDQMISSMKTPYLSTREDLTNFDSLPNSYPGSFKISNSDSWSNSFNGTVVRTGSMLTTFLHETKVGQLLLFPYATDGEARISKFINGELKLDPRYKHSDIYDHKPCFLRVHLRPFKEGCFEEGAVICAPYPSDIFLWTSSSEKNEKGLQMSQSAMRLYFKEHSSGRWEMQIPDDSMASKSHRWPIGFVTTGSVQGSKSLVAEGFCEAVLLSHLREEQWKEMPMKKRREIYVLVRNLRSTAYRLALASIVLEYKENDIGFL